MHKNIPNYHTHSKYCDGKGKLEDFVLSAIEKNMPTIGFSGHAPVPFESWWNMSDDIYQKYLLEIKDLKDKYSEKIQIYTGIEADFIDGINSPIKYQEDVDYIISAIHFLSPEKSEKPWDFIISHEVFKTGLDLYFKNEINVLIKYYFKQMNIMVEKEKPQIIAHFDQIQKFNKGNIFFSEDDKLYQQTISESLKLVSENDSIIEINTRGKLKNLTENFYPSNQFIKKCFDFKISIMLSSDAHTPEEVDSYLNEASKIVYDIGYREIFIFWNNKLCNAELTKNQKLIFS